MRKDAGTPSLFIAGMPCFQVKITDRPSRRDVPSVRPSVRPHRLHLPEVDLYSSRMKGLSLAASWHISKWTGGVGFEVGLTESDVRSYLISKTDLQGAGFE